MQDEWLTAEETAALLKVTELTLMRWRIAGKGPRFSKLTGRYGVRYRRSAIEQWMNERERQSTSERVGST